MARPSAMQEQPNVGGPAKAGLVYPGLTVPFVLVVACFAAWGSAANLTDVLVGVFRHIFDMSNFQSALVQFAYYGAYFSLAIPAALINRRFGYKAGVLTGLGLAAVGGLLFIPASSLLEFAPFLLALIVLPNITPEAAKTIMSPAELRQSQEDDLALVLGPYLGIAAVLVLIWVLIAFQRMQTPPEVSQDEGEARSG